MKYQQAIQEFQELEEKRLTEEIRLQDIEDKI